MKSKKHHADLRSDLHFTTPASLENCTKRLGWISHPDVIIQMEEINSDLIIFVMEWRRDGVPNSRVQGRLRRWQGTDTRLDADSDMQTPGFMKELSQQIIVQIGVVGIILSLCGFWAMGVSYPGDFRNVLAWIDWFWWWYAIPILVVSFFAARWYIYRGVRQRELQAQIDIDRMLQMIVEVFAGVEIKQVETPTAYEQSQSNQRGRTQVPLSNATRIQDADSVSLHGSRPHTGKSGTSAGDD